MSDETKIAETGNIEARVRELEAQLEALSSQLKPDNLAKSIDSSYLSTNNLRVFRKRQINPTWGWLSRTFSCRGVAV